MSNPVRSDVIAVGLVVTAWHVAERVARQAPFATEVLAVLADGERVALRALRAHLAHLEPPRVIPSGEAEADQRDTPAEVLRSLLDASMYSRPDEARDTLYLSLLGGLLPDEARILAALSDGSAYPVIDVGPPVFGTTGAYVLTNASTVGRAAGVTLPECTPHYVTRLVLAGLAEIGPEGGAAMYDEYEMLLTDAAVNIALTTARRGVRSARVVRRTVRITELGRGLWEAAK